MALPQTIPPPITVTPQEILDELKETTEKLGVLIEFLDSIPQVTLNSKIEINRRLTCTGGGPWSS